MTCRTRATSAPSCARRRGGVEQVLLSRLCAFAWSPKVLRAGQGAHFLTTIVEDVDLAAWVASFRAEGGHVAAAVAHDGADLYATPMQWPLAIAIGNEGAGISAPLLEKADARVTIRCRAAWNH